MVRAASVLLILLCAGPLAAHPEIDDALSRLNAAIAAAPGNADLFVQRGELYVRHEEWMQAEANLLRAAELNPAHPRLDRVHGVIELATGRPQTARDFFDRVLARDPRDIECLVLRARALSQLKQVPAAVGDFDAALGLIENPPPELFLERAALLDAAAAIRSLDAGIARIGPAITLHLRAAALEESLGRIDAALARLDVLATQSERKEVWLKRRGDLLARAGRPAEARSAYAAALAAIRALPDWLRASPEISRLVLELTPLAHHRS